MTDHNMIEKAISNLQRKLRDADNLFDRWVNEDDDFYNPTWTIESCFLQLMAIVESMNLPMLRELVKEEFDNIKKSKESFGSGEQMPDGEPYSIVISRVRCYANALRGFFPQDTSMTVTREVKQILRDIHYVIGDKQIYGTCPRCEQDIHLRIEGVLKCVFPDLKHKPTLTKQIKNFEPDTGIPSIHTLIEYKFLTRKADIALIADQILADTRGYLSPEWKYFVYIIYETKRFRKEKEWNQLLKESGVPENTSIIVLGGEGDTVGPSTRSK